jgi:hypothetical protein
MVQMQQSIPQENAQESVQEKSRSIGERVAALNWTAMNSDLDHYGCATIGPLLTPEQCTILAASYDSDQLFRSRIIMARHGFGRGEYKYFAYPLPQIVAGLRDAFYPALAQVANRWNKALGIAVTYPSTHAAYLRRCHCDGQSKPTPLLLRYGPGDFNCLHQDIYGENIFPLQVAFLLSEPERDFTAANFYSPSNDRACNRALRSCRCGKARA